MQRFDGTLVFVFLTVFNSLAPMGCGSRTTAPPTAPKPPAIAAKAVPVAAVVRVDSKQPLSTEKRGEEASAKPTEKSPGESPSAKATAVAAPADVAADVPPVSTERILLFAPLNPIVIELQLTIDGAPHTAALDKLVEEVLQIADTDGDGRTTWKELCACRKVKYGQYGNLAVDNENSEKQVIDRYDIARDGVVGRAELPRFLTRNAGGSRPFSIRGTLDYRDLNRRAAPTWRVIDADDDGTLSADEWASAARRLAGRDNDDDEILVTADLNPLLLAGGMDMAMERRRRGPDAARLLGPHADWSAIQLALEGQYGGARGLKPDSFPRTPELFGQLDENHDGRIRRDEFKALDHVPPHLIIAADFGRPRPTTGEDQATEPADEAPSTAPPAAEPEPAAEPASLARPAVAEPRLRLVYVAPAFAVAGQSAVELPGRLTLSLGGMALTFYTNDMVASDDFAERARQALAMFDQNKDGYLENDEIPESLQGQLGRFEALDADDDGKAYPAEIEAFLAQQQAGLRAQIHAKAADRDDLLFAAIDADHDERLDSRDIESVGQHLAGLDANGDGSLTPDELPEVLMIGLARGSLENADATFAPPPIVLRRPGANAPRWFTAMDANQDGAISRREFLGTADQFSALDSDANGLLDLVESGSGSIERRTNSTAN